MKITEEYLKIFASAGACAEGLAVARELGEYERLPQKYRCWAACNPNTPPDVLTALARDADVYVRYWVARNAHTPKEALALLANDEDYRVRARIASNANTPKEVLAILEHDAEEYVRELATWQHDHAKACVEIERALLSGILPRSI